MPTSYTSRILIIAAVIFVGIWSIFPGMLKLKPEMSGRFRPDLKPGIDMVGGTSLLYEIKSESGGPSSGRLAEEVMSALKKRVDPDGQRNLIWRPQGNERLEIQMPLTANSGESKKKRQEFAEAQRQLEQTNVRSSAVLNAVEQMTGDARRNRLSQLAAGSAQREKLFGALASVWDQLQQARKEQNATAQADKEIEYNDLRAQIESTNVGAASLESTLASPAGAKRLGELKQQFADFPARLEALERFAKAHAEYQAVKGSLDDAGELKRLLQGSGVLEFHIIVEYEQHSPPPDVKAMIDRLLERGPVVQAADTMRWYQLDRPEEMRDVAVTDRNGQAWVLAYTDPAHSMANRAGQPHWELARATAESDPSSGERVVSFEFDAQGADYFGDLTQTNLTRRLGIVLDDRMISAPVINSRISARGQITGNRNEGGFSAKEQGYLVSMLRAGSLPARLTDEPIREQTVGPQIGADNLKAGLIACGFGLFVVAVFLIGYYYLAGVVAFIAVLLNMVIILGAMAAMNATFTLPGVAGIVLTIGMAVDANVLIFERLREEQQRGLSLRMALRNAYDRAWSAILDGNVTTGITAGALYVFGSEEVKGFGLTLLIGIGASLFTALYVTKTIFGLLIDYGGVTKLGSLPLTFPKWDKMLRPNIDWMGKAKYFYAFSAIFILIGLTLFGIKLKQGQMMDIEFASGTGVQFELKQPLKIEEVRHILNAESARNPDGLPSPSIYSVENSETTYEVVTPTADAVKVREAILTSLGDRLKLELPSQFKGSDQPFAQLLNNQIVPIKKPDQQIAGFTPSQLTSHLEGVAIVLENLTPPLKPSEVKTRVERVRLQPVPGGSIQPYRDTDVVNADGNDEPSKTLVVLVSDPRFPHKDDEAKWAQELAEPIWRLVSEGVGGAPSLQKLVNFDAQVASETQREASLAMILSIGGIMAYHWLRFGNLKYGTATVVALAHDVLFTLAAIGFAHYIAPTFIGRALLIEPFRINLTMVAALLTIMGYSMNDTVVIFDRIRENRGKFGAVSRRVINDSVNQTLSRTLLTGGTTILTIFVMYVWGGPGIHGFTYALLLGILVGTYSSIAIASPILLFGDKGTDEGPREEKRESKGTGKSLEPVGQLQRA
ncbi:MAG: SecD/SecF fusion protein [Humisphaera sp.]|nr:SecD/SecF fusion protein [Humisphaera sp.]